MATDRKWRQCLMPSCRGQRRDLVHKFPMNNDRAERWRQIINDPQLMQEPLDQVRKKRFICNRHFRPQDYKNVESRSLNTTADPSLMMQRTSEDGIDDEHLALEEAAASSNNVMRLEINFDTVEVMHASQMNRENRCDYVEKISLSEAELLEEGIISILEPSPNKSNTYRLTTAATSTRESSQGALSAADNSINYITSPGDQSTIFCTDPLPHHHTNQQKTAEKQGTSDNDNGVHYEIDGEYDDEPNETSEMLLIPLSTESFRQLQNRLLLQQSQQSASSSSEKMSEIVLDDLLMECNASHEEDLIEMDGPDDVESDMTPAAEVPVSIAHGYTVAIGATNECSTQIAHPSWTEALEVCHVWLRDHCRCEECYNHETFQRKQNVLDIALDIRPQSVRITEDGELRVTWPDQHESVFELGKLRAHFDAGKSSTSTPSSSVTRTLWTAQSIEKLPVARVSLNDLLCDDQQARSIVESLVRFGVAFIEKVPPNLQSTEVAVKRLFSVHKTLFGEMWTVSASFDHADTAYSQSDLGAHTDNTYFNDAAGLQVLHCVQHTGEGGKTLLLDGFQAAQALRARNAKVFERLCRLNVPAEYVEEGQHHRYEAPILRRTPDGKDLEQIRFNLYDRAPMTALPAAETHQFYSDLRELTAEIQSPVNEWWFKLQPGTVVIFDNWRLMHGRSAYTGRRQLCGCYVSRTEFQSVARTMGLID